MYALFLAKIRRLCMMMMKNNFFVVERRNAREWERYEKCIKYYKRIKIKFRKNDVPIRRRSEWRRDEEPLKKQQGSKKRLNQSSK